MTIWVDFAFRGQNFFRNLKKISCVWAKFFTLVLGVPREKHPVRRGFWVPTVQAAVNGDRIGRSQDLPRAVTKRQSLASR